MGNEKKIKPRSKQIKDSEIHAWPDLYSSWLKNAPRKEDLAVTPKLSLVKNPIVLDEDSEWK